MLRFVFSTGGSNRFKLYFDKNIKPLCSSDTVDYRCALLPLVKQEYPVSTPLLSQRCTTISFPCGTPLSPATHLSIVISLRNFGTG